MTTMPDSVGYGTNSQVRLFEKGMDFVALLENEPILSLMERVLGKNLHIIALQGHRMYKGNEVLAWHADEVYVTRPPGEREVTEANAQAELPPTVNAINCHYYLVDVPEDGGPTRVVPGSHRAARQPVKTIDGDPPKWRGNAAVSLTCKAGDCVMYSNQTWHSGSPNISGRTRLSVVPCYARRFVAQRFWPFLNYNLSRDILDQCTPRQREILGEHQRGAYG
jgi:ectoine hydroxylase-related dioxygenase (phytanoyl-CoA dioxygenase family)